MYYTLSFYLLLVLVFYKQVCRSSVAISEDGMWWKRKNPELYFEQFSYG